MDFEDGRSRFMPNFDLISTRLLKVALMGNSSHYRNMSNILLNNIAKILHDPSLADVSDS